VYPLEQSAAAELREAREVAAQGRDGCDDFRVRVLGGAWTAAHKGVSFDAYRGECCCQQASVFLEAQQPPKSARFDVAVYTVAGAALMARTWCEKCQHLFDIATAHEDDKHSFT
jgi:hypothetical protein